MYVKYLKKIYIGYSSIIYNHKSYNLQKKNTSDQNKKCKAFV